MAASPADTGGLSGGKVQSRLVNSFSSNQGRRMSSRQYSKLIASSSGCRSPKACSTSAGTSCVKLWASWPISALASVSFFQIGAW